MLFKGSNNLVQIYRSFVITGNYEGGAFLNMVFLTTMLTTADVNIHALIAKYGINIQIVRPEMTKFKMFRDKVNTDFYFVGITF
jgi:hypothetical protein